MSCDPCALPVEVRNRSGLKRSEPSSGDSLFSAGQRGSFLQIMSDRGADQEEPSNGRGGIRKSPPILHTSKKAFSLIPHESHFMTELRPTQSA